MSPRALIQTLDENTSVPLKIVVPVVAAVVGGVWWLSTQMADLGTRMTRLEVKIEMMGARAEGK